MANKRGARGQIVSRTTCRWITIYMTDLIDISLFCMIPSSPSPYENKMCQFFRTTLYIVFLLSYPEDCGSGKFVVGWWESCAFNVHFVRRYGETQLWMSGAQEFSPLDAYYFGLCRGPPLIRSWWKPKIEGLLYALGYFAPFVFWTCSRASQFDATPKVDTWCNMPLVIKTPILIAIAHVIPWYYDSYEGCSFAPHLFTRLFVFGTCAHVR